MTAEAAGNDVSMATVTPAEGATSKAQPAMSARASAFTIASLMADHDSSAGCCPVSTTSSATTDGDCVSTSGMCCGHRQSPNVESPSGSPQNCGSCTNVGVYHLLLTAWSVVSCRTKKTAH